MNDGDLPDDDLPDDPFDDEFEDEDDAELVLEEEEERVPLSDELEQALSAFVLIADPDLAVSRAETVDTMVDALRELEEDEEVAEWVSDHGASDFHLSQGRDGQLVISDVFPVTGLIGYIPKEVVAQVTSELMEQEEEDRASWLDSLSELTTEWVTLLSDEEKMVGHLIRAHEVPVQETTGDQDDLITRHSHLHAGT